jgi:hypothetical protein
MTAGIEVPSRRTFDAPHVPRRRRGRRVAAYTLGGIVALTGTGWLGLRIEPQALPDAGLEAGPIATVPLADGLPEPVDRFYRTLYGDQVPVVETAVVSGRGQMRVNGITFPARYRFSHVAGHDYRHYIEVTWFGRRLLAVNEWFLDGTARLELPFGVMEGPKIDQGANLALWAEAGWFPSIWLTDTRTSWEPIDATSALLRVPFGDVTEEFTVTFDPDTGLLERMESMRFKGEENETKTLWLNEALDWDVLDGATVPMTTTVTWADEGTPWTRLRTEELILNADLDRYIEAEGP